MPRRWLREWCAAQASAAVRRAARTSVQGRCALTKERGPRAYASAVGSVRVRGGPHLRKDGAVAAHVNHTVLERAVAAPIVDVMQKLEAVLQLVGGAHELGVAQAEALDGAHILGRQVQFTRVVEQLLCAREAARTMG